MYAEQRRSSDNMSARSSDSDMSDVSAISHASSASRLSSTSYMSIQSERPGGRLRSVTAAVPLTAYVSANCMLISPSVFSCTPLAVACFGASACFLHPRTRTHKLETQRKLRSKSLEEDKKDRRISWGVDGEEEESEAGHFSEELKHRRHTVAGDTRESRYSLHSRLQVLRSTGVIGGSVSSLL